MLLQSRRSAVRGLPADRRRKQVEGNAVIEDMSKASVGCPDLLVHSKSFVADMRTVEGDYRRISRRLTSEEWQQEPRKATVLDGLARLTSALQ